MPWWCDVCSVGGWLCEEDVTSFCLGFAVSLGQRKFSDLDFRHVLVRHSLILHCTRSDIIEPLDGFFFCGCSCCACGVCAAWTAAGSLRLLYNLSGCVLLVLLLRWRRGVGSRLFLCILSASPAQAGLLMIAGCLAL